MIRTHFLFISALLFLTIGAAFLPGDVHAQSLSQQYLERAETMYNNVWKHYRVGKYPGLFSENYPSGNADTLTYFEGGGVKEKEVSFLWPFSGVFSATNALLQIPSVKKKYLPYLDTCTTGVLKYRDSKRKPAGYQAYPVQFEKSDRYYDDNGLVVIDYMEGYFNTRDTAYLSRAKEVFAFIISGWGDELGGGVTWLEGHRDQKPACSNGSATISALKIYQGSKDPYYLNWGKKFYDWMYNNLKDSSGVYANDKKMDGSVNKTFWTYNSGFMLESAVVLYEATKDEKYLNQAKELARDTYKHFSNVPHDDRFFLKIDLPWFVTVLFRGYEALYQQDGNMKYIQAVENDLNFAWSHSRDKYGFITKSWQPDPAQLNKPKWLLDEACIAELYARLSIIRKNNAE